MRNTYNKEKTYKYNVLLLVIIVQGNSHSVDIHWCPPEIVPNLGRTHFELVFGLFLFSEVLNLLIHFPIDWKKKKCVFKRFIQFSIERKDTKLQSDPITKSWPRFRSKWGQNYKKKKKKKKNNINIPNISPFLSDRYFDPSGFKLNSIK